MYVCDGSKDQCTAVSTAIATANKAIGSGNLTSSQAKALSGVVNFYGKEGEKNGVTVAFGGNSGLASTKLDGQSPGSVTVSLGNGFSKYYTKGYAGADAAGEQSGILMHEGQHGIDERAMGHNPGTAAEERATEHNAWSVQSYVSKGLGDTSVRGLWSPSWPAGSAEGMRQSAVNRQTDETVQYWCEQGGNCQ